MNLLFRHGSYLPQMSEYAFKNISESQFPKMIYLYGVWCSEYFCISFLECHFNCVFMMRCRESKIVSSTFFSKRYQPFLDISKRRREDSVFLLICAHLYVTLFKFSRFFTSVFFFNLNPFHGHTLNDFVFHPVFISTRWRLFSLSFTILVTTRKCCMNVTKSKINEYFHYLPNNRALWDNLLPFGRCSTAPAC